VSSVYLGGNDLGDLSEGELIEVVEAIPYPEFSDSFDIGLLKLSRDATQALPEIAVGCALEELADGVIADIVGYGAIDEYGTRYSDFLMEAQVSIVDADCDSPDLGCQSAVNPGGELVAGGQEADTCYGDSGGPIFLETSYGVPALLGITSRGASVEGPPCATGGIYVRLDAVIDWIENMTQETLSRPNCEPVENHRPEPWAETLVVSAGSSAAVQINPGDPDPYDNHTYTLTRSPLLGAATLGATGIVTYSAPSGSSGFDALEVRVDDGDLAATIEVEVNITGPVSDSSEPGDTGDTGDTPVSKPRCGCANVPQQAPRNAPQRWGWLWAPLVLLTIRSRRPGPRWTGPP
jgi:hypothetical protein